MGLCFIKSWCKTFLWRGRKHFEILNLVMPLHKKRTYKIHSCCTLFQNLPQGYVDFKWSSPIKVYIHQLLSWVYLLLFQIQCSLHIYFSQVDGMWQVDWSWCQRLAQWVQDKGWWKTLCLDCWNKMKIQWWGSLSSDNGKVNGVKFT